MQDDAIIDAIERYLRGEMLPEEKAFFEHLRKTQPDIDQQVVEHTLFLNQLAQYGEISQLKTQLNDIHQDLSATGSIEKPRPAKVVVLFNKYKRVIGVAASIAGITALGISGLISYLSPKVSNEDLQLLRRRLTNTEQTLNKVANQLNEPSSARAAINFKSGGTGFLIDGKGYLITNAHVVRNATLVEVQNTLGEYQARIIQLDPQSDLALLKIEDSTYHPFNGLPYGISRTGAEMGEDLFTLGYPRPQIVYNKGYMSAETGFEGDTLACQITIAANPGNSGTPVLNSDGEVIGIVSSSQQGAQGVVFAVKSKNIFRAIDAMKSDSTLLKTDSSLSYLHIPLNSGLKGLDRKQQIKRIKDYIFIVKSNQ